MASPVERSSYIANTDVFHQRRVKIASFDHFLKHLQYQLIKLCIFKTTLFVFAKRRSYGESDDNVLRMLLQSVLLSVSGKSFAPDRADMLSMMEFYGDRNHTRLRIKRQR